MWRHRERGGMREVLCIYKDLGKDGRGENLIKIYFMKTARNPGADRASILTKEQIQAAIQNFVLRQ